MDPATYVWTKVFDGFEYNPVNQELCGGGKGGAVGDNLVYLDNCGAFQFDTQALSWSKLSDLPAGFPDITDATGLVNDGDVYIAARDSVWRFSPGTQTGEKLTDIGSSQYKISFVRDGRFVWGSGFVSDYRNAANFQGAFSSIDPVSGETQSEPYTLPAQTLAMGAFALGERIIVLTNKGAYVLEDGSSEFVALPINVTYSA